MKHDRHAAWGGLLRVVLLGLGAAATLRAQTTFPSFDFTQASGRAGWVAANQISKLEPTAEGLAVTLAGSDPFLTGPSRNYPVGQNLWLRLKLKSATGGTCQLFYYDTAPSESKSVRFTVPAGAWVEGRVAVPSLGSGYRIRIDPPGASGVCTLASLRFEARGVFPDFDLTTLPAATEWHAQHDIASLTPTLEGLRIQIGGSDPYMAGPARDYPADVPLWMTLRLKSDAGGMGQVFYYQSGATEEHSVRFNVVRGEWVDVRVRVPALGSSYGLRLDPPGTSGNCILASLRFEERVVPQAPSWPRPGVPELGSEPLMLESGGLKILHGSAALGQFEVQVEGERMAVGNREALLGYLFDGQSRWIPFGHGSNATVRVFQEPRTALADRQIGGRLHAQARMTDPDGATWEIEQTFEPGQAGAIVFTTRVMVDRDRDLLFLPALTLLPGLGSFGTNKTQAIMAGIEYLENEPSSSTADLNAPASDRQVPDLLKFTFPLMAVASGNHYVGLAWNRDQTNVCAFFDSPDRFFNSGAHLMGLLVPGSDGDSRDENNLIPYGTLRFPAGRSCTVNGLILGGEGDTVVPAVRQYVSLFGLPSIPNLGISAQDYFVLAARGWLDSQIRDGDRYRHATGASFGSTPAADAALYMDWLAQGVGDASLASRLTQAAQAARGQVPNHEYNAYQVGHVRYPVPALVYGAVSANAESARARARSNLGRFQADGSVLYVKPADGLDYSRTHWAREANGLTAGVLAGVLDDARFAGDPSALEAGLRHLRSLGKFRHTVPRGAQTWEIPLHTPDILAAAYLVRAYTLGYELTRDPDFLDQARDWAWTGVPFVYLSAPTPQPVGVYSTIPVLGATAWVAPNWIGLPVQWCGLVYADALHRFAPYDPTGPWKTIADGIAAAGIQHSYPIDDPDYLGLLPDSYNLRPQTRNGPNINPATVLAPAVRLLTSSAVYEAAVCNGQGLVIHAPGKVSVLEEGTEDIRFRVEGWPSGAYFVLVTGVRALPVVRVNGAAVSLSAPNSYESARKRLVLQLNGTAEVELRHPALAALKIQGRAAATVRVSWPAAATGAILEVASDGIGERAWEPSTALAHLWGTEYVVEDTPLESQRWYRLRLDF